MFRSWIALRTLRTGRVRMLSKSPSSSRPCKSVALPTWEQEADLPSHRTNQFRLAWQFFPPKSLTIEKERMFFKVFFTCMDFISKATTIKRIMLDLVVPCCTWVFNSAAYALWDTEENRSSASCFEGGNVMSLMRGWNVKIKRGKLIRSMSRYEQWERRVSVPPSGKLTINEDLQQLWPVNSSKLSRDSEGCVSKGQAIIQINWGTRDGII